MQKGLHRISMISRMNRILCKALSRDAATRGFTQKLRNPTHGSGWIIQMLSKRNTNGRLRIPPTVVGGLFKFLFEKHLKYPPAAVGGIKSAQKMSVETT